MYYFGEVLVKKKIEMQATSGATVTGSFARSPFPLRLRLFAGKLFLFEK